MVSLNAKTFRQHLDGLWATGRPTSVGWGRLDIDDLHTIIGIPGLRPEGTRDWYFLKLGAEYYDLAPPTATFVNPDNWADAIDNSRWFPLIDNPSWFGLHSAYRFPDGSKRQLVSCSMVAQFYMMDHSLEPTEVWQKGRDTLAATLDRIAEVLGPNHYRRPSLDNIPGL